MSTRITVISAFLLLFFASGIFAMESDANSNNEESGITITKKEVEAYLKGEYNRTFTYYGDISIIGAIELENKFLLRAGASIGRSSGETDIRSFFNAGYLNFLGVPVNMDLFYIYNGLPDYHAHTQTVLPVISYNAKHAGISLGMNFRFSHFFDGPLQFESLLTFYVYFNFIYTDSLQIGVSIGNFNEFQAKNMGAYSLIFYSNMRLDKNLSIINEIELMQSGGDGLSTILYGFAWRGGVKVSW